MTTRDPFNLLRFVEAQSGSYDRAISELRGGRKLSHWMWFVLPQMQGLGHSEMARRYGISGLDEARAYLAHPVLGERLEECAQVLEMLDARLSASDVFGSTDAMKLRSCLTLFAQASEPNSIFERLLSRYFGGMPDDKTLALLKTRARA